MVWKNKLEEVKANRKIRDEIMGEESEEEPEEEQEEKVVQQPKKLVSKTNRPLVMMELPTKQLRVLTDESNGEKFDVYTLLEAVQEILENTREIKKEVV